MAIVWQKSTRTATYEVRSAGRAMRLYRNGVLHSQWNPGRPLNGSFWELFLLASYGLKKRPARILLLGVGGGAVVNLFSRFNRDANNLEVVGVEIDASHLHVAKRYFKINHEICELHCCDAIEWISDYSDNKFDLIIDDLFIEWEKQPQRVITSPSLWHRKLLSLLKRQGGLVVNFADDVEWRSMRSAMRKNNNRSFINLLSFQHKQCQNRIVLFARESLSLGSLKENLAASEADKMIRSIQDNTFRVRSLRL